MKTKKRLTGILIILLVLLLLAGSSVFGVRAYRAYTDSRDNQYLMNLSVAPAGESGYYGPLPAAYEPGQERPISFTVSNGSYIPVQVREVLLLSVYDQNGTPVFLDGSPYTESSVELRSENGTLVKALENHQAVYVSEYTLEAGKPLFEARSEWEESAASHQSSEYSLVTAENSPYAGYVLRMDLFLYGRPQAYPYADWQPLASVSNILENPAVPAALETSFSAGLSLPTFSSAQTYHWELDSGKALLAGIGNMQEPDAVIPGKVWLSETPEGYVEDPVTGTCYDVKVKGNAFYDSKQLQTVTFRDGASIAGNIMWDGRKQGMFEGCTALTAVNNIPDGVISMEETFQRCASLESMPQLPATVENLNSCFLGCTALRNTASIPESALSLKACFQGCTALKDAPAFPEGVTDLSDCFNGCTALKTVASVPSSVTKMDRTFADCHSLSESPVLPDGLKSMAATFYNCTNLAEVSNLPDTVVNLDSCFEQCSNLETVPDLPAQAFILDECFKGCTSLSGTVTLPGEAFAYSNFLAINTDKIFDGCVALDAIQVDGCTELIEAEEISADIPVHFTKTHTRKNCDSCHIFSGDFDVNGLPVVMDEVWEIQVPMFMDILEDIPECLIATCDRIVFTSNWNHTEWAAGVYYWDSRNAYIHVHCVYHDHRIANISIAEDISGGLQEAVRVDEFSYRTTVFHELAHGYDRHSSSSILSDTSRWRELYAKEGTPFNPPSEFYASHEFSRECFARATAAYFCDSLHLNSTPGIHAYLEELFGDAA